MAVQRNSEQYTPGTKDTRKMSTPGITAATAQVDRVVQVGDASSWRSNLVQNIVGFTNKVASDVIDSKTAEAYVQGASQAGRGAVEAELQNDSITRDWEVAGFRDAMGRMAIADAKAQQAEDMVWLREQSPEKMQEYLAQQRRALMPQLNGMSLNSRQTLIPQVVLGEQASLQAHKAAHAQHIVDVTMKAESATLSTAVRGMDMAREARDTAAYEAAVQQAAGAVWGVYNNDRLPAKAKEQLAQEFLELSLTGKHLGMYEYLRDFKMPGQTDVDGAIVDGTPATLLNRLPLTVQEKLGSSYAKAKEATAAIANTDFLDRGTLERAALDKGEGTWSYEQTVAYLDAGMVAIPAVFTPAFRDQHLQAFFKAQHKAQAGLGAATAYLNNNVGWLKENGFDVADGLTAAKKFLKGVPAPEQFKRYIEAGERGQVGAYKAAGEVVNGAVASLSDPDGKLSVENAALLGQVHTRLQEAEAKGDPLGAVMLLEGLTPENAKRLERWRALHASGIQGQVALDQLKQAEVEDKKLSPQEKAVIADRNARADIEYVDSIGKTGWFGRIGLRLHSLLGTEAGQQSGTELVLENRGGVGLPFSSPAQPFLHGHYLKEAKSAVLEELRNIDLVGSNLDSAARVRMAQAAVQRRLLETSNGTIVLPKGQTPNSYFGVPSSVPVEVVQQAFNDTLKPSTQGGKFLVTAMHNKLSYVEVDHKGVPIPSAPPRQEIDPRIIAGKVQEYENKQANKMREAVGAGVEYVKDDVKFSYNGKNTVGAREVDMVEFRKALVQNEGVRNTAYKDTLGIETVGVGIAKGKNKWYPKVGPDGRVSNADIANSFYHASNDAAGIGLRLQEQSGLKNPAAFKLFAEAAYHGLGNFAPVVVAARNRDQAGALAALQNSKAYQLSGPARKKHYEQLLNEALKG